MRLKTFSGASMQEVMTQVRAALGPDAIIVSSHQGKGGGAVKVVAAVETVMRPETEKPAQSPEGKRHAEAAPGKPAAAPSLPPSAPSSPTILSVLDHHGVPRPLADQLERMARSIEADSEHLALAGALDTAYSFVPLSLTQNRPLLLTGAPGAGKTSSIAKLAARAALEGRSVKLFTTDTERTGGIEQLSGFGELLDLDVTIAKTADELRRALAKVRPEKPDLMLVDTAGINAFAADELAFTKELAIAIDAEIIVVVAAGGDAYEAAEIAQAYTRLGAQRFIATRLDATRRYGSLLSFASGGPLSFAAVSATPYIAEGLQNINPVSLARLLKMPPLAGSSTPSLKTNKLVQS